MIGAIVKCIKTPCACHHCTRFTPKRPTKDGIYTVRDFIEKGVLKMAGGFSGGAEKDMYLLEEINNGIIYPMGQEIGFPTSIFEILLPPMEIKIEDIIKEGEPV